MTRERSLEHCWNGAWPCREKTDTEAVKTWRGLKGLDQPSMNLSDPGLYGCVLGPLGSHVGSWGLDLGSHQSVQGWTEASGMWNAENPGERDIGLSGRALPAPRLNLVE